MNPNLLRAKITEIGLTQAQVANGIGISSNSLSRKLSGKREFKLSEVTKLCEFLNISNPIDVFFEQKVP